MEIKNHKLVGITYDESQHTRGPITPKFIIMHYTAGGTALGSVRAIERRGLSAHLFVDRDGSVIQTVPFNVKALHAGKSRFRGFSGLNGHSIGIEIANFGYLDRKVDDGWTRDGLRKVFGPGEVVVASHFAETRTIGWEAYTDEQIQSVEAITKTLLTAYPTIIDIAGHDEIAVPRGRKLDPGPAFDIERFRRLIGTQDAEDGALDSEGVFEVVTRSSSLNLRGGPGTSFETIGTLAKGHLVTVADFDGKWAAVDVEGDGIIDGFAHGDFLRLVRRA